MTEEEKAAQKAKPVATTPIPGTPWYVLAYLIHWKKYYYTWGFFFPIEKKHVRYVFIYWMFWLFIVVRYSDLKFSCYKDFPLFMVLFAMFIVHKCVFKPLKDLFII